MIDYIKKALYFSSKEHDGQYRKGDRVPYIVHPVLVAFGVSMYTNDKEVIASAFLHDVLEDCPNVSIELLHEEFSDRIVQIVRDVTFISTETHQTWKERKTAYMEKIKNASNDALLIIAVDKMTNFQSYFEALKQKSNFIKDSFKGSPEEYYWYYSKCAEILAAKLGNHRIVKDYNIALNKYSKNIKPFSKF